MYSRILWTLIAIASATHLVNAAVLGHAGAEHGNSSPGVENSIWERSLLQPRNACGRDDKLEAGSSYTLYNNLWGVKKGDKGYQCVDVDHVDGNEVAWHADFSWERGEGGVKSYPSLQLHHRWTELQYINSMWTKFNWDLTCKNGGKVGASVVYDLFAGPKDNDHKCQGHKTNEIMIWPGQLGGSSPISTSYNPYKAYRSGIKIPNTGGLWDLYKGPNSGTTVHSFVPRNGKAEWVDLHEWDGNLKNFIQWLVDAGEIPKDYCLIESNAGTEPTYGQDCKFEVKKFGMELK